MTETTFPVVVTDAALAALKRLVAKDGREGVFVRLGVKGGGCSGFEYLSRLDVERKPIDLSAVIDGVEIVCDAKSAEFVRGATFDHTSNLMGGGFKWTNPNAVRSCGCGTSFTPR